MFIYIHVFLLLANAVWFVYFQSEETGSSAVVQHCVCDNNAIEPAKSAKIDLKPVPIAVESGSEMPHRAVLLSNKERLLLRKQALKMKTRPVLAVGNFLILFHSFQFSLIVVKVVIITTFAFSNFIQVLVGHNYHLSCILLQFFVHLELFLYGINCWIFI